VLTLPVLTLPLMLPLPCTPLQGLQDVIGVSVTHPTWQRTRPDSADDKHTGWAFVAPEDTPLSSSTGARHACHHLPDLISLMMMRVITCLT
jgi:hypothetical protein